MTGGLAFLAGYITGVVTTFALLGIAIRPHLLELRSQLRQERRRRIEAEDTAAAYLEDEVRIIGEFPPIDAASWEPVTGKQGNVANE